MTHSKFSYFADRKKSRDLHILFKLMKLIALSIYTCYTLTNRIRSYYNITLIIIFLAPSRNHLV